jgi:hypothetical protein
MATLTGALALTGCGVDGYRPGDHTAPTLSPSATGSPWGYKPVDTSCTDWLQGMTAGQRATMTVELLDYLRTHPQLAPSPTQSAAVPTVDQAQVFEEALDAQCYAPECTERVVVVDGGQPVFVGEIAHIVGAVESGPRGAAGSEVETQPGESKEAAHVFPGVGGERGK